MKKKIAAAAALLVLLLGIRIWMVNRGIESPEVVQFEMGEEAEIGRNIFNDRVENMNGYSVTAESARIKTYEDYLKKYSYNEEEDGVLFEEDSMLRPEMIYEVDILVKNYNEEDNTGCGISYSDYKLTASDFMLSVSSPLYWIANDIAEENQNLMMSFRLRPESEMRFHLPFYFAPESPAESVSEEAVRDADLQLVLSLYPEQRQIRIDETE